MYHPRIRQGLFLEGHGRSRSATVSGARSCVACCLFHFQLLHPSHKSDRRLGFQREPPEKRAHGREIPHMPHGESKEVCFHRVDDERFGERRDDDPAIERNPLWKEGAPFQGKGKKESVCRMKRPNRLHDLSFAQGLVSQAVIAGLAGSHSP